MSSECHGGTQGFGDASDGLGGSGELGGFGVSS